MPTTNAAARDYLRIYVWVLCTIVVIGESLTLLLTNKYWPQGMDELAFSLSLFVLTARPLTTQRLTLMFGSFWFLFGSLYTMFFSRLDPNGGTGERMAGLLVLMAGCLVGAAWSYRRLQLDPSLKADAPENSL
jgi:hypothetical protein